MKKFYLFFVFVLFLSCLYSQQKNQITKFAVVDTQRVYNTFKQNSGLIRDYEDKKSRYQREIQSFSDEIIELKKQKAKAQKNGDSDAVANLTEEINAKTRFLTEFSKAKNDELASIKANLNNNKFYQSLYAVIKKIAMKEGYSMVLSLQNEGAILWYSPTVDITQSVIVELRKI